MALNKQSNVYTVTYIVAMVLVVGVALSGTFLALKGKQQANIDADKMRQILAAVHITTDGENTISTFDSVVVAQKVYNSQGVEVPGDAFTIDVKAESQLKASERKLPVYECRLKDGSMKYVVPVYGSGLWGPIWGYLAFDANGSTIYGAYFAHQGETPGLGAEIEKPNFCNQFDGKNVIRNGTFEPIEVVKKGLKPTADCDYVDGVSGGTITSKGVNDMLGNCLTPYRAFLMNLNNK